MRKPDAVSGKRRRQEHLSYISADLHWIDFLGSWPDARIGTWRDRVTYAKHLEAEFKAMEQDFTHLGEEDLRLYKAMKRWHNEVCDMLA
jgi:hypothetical protein